LPQRQLNTPDAVFRVARHLMSFVKQNDPTRTDAFQNAFRHLVRLAFSGVVTARRPADHQHSAPPQNRMNKEVFVADRRTKE
jgi:hypothetical protein